MRFLHPILIRLALLTLTACTAPPTLLPSASAPPTSSPFPASPPPGPSPSAIQPANPTPRPASFWADPAVPAALRQQLRTSLPENDSPEQATLRLRPTDSAPGEHPTLSWYYALVAPFATLTDEVTLDDFLQAWSGKPTDTWPAQVLLMDSSTYHALVARFGPPAPEAVQILPAERLLVTAWETPNRWAVIPFEDLHPKWKVIAINGQSPIRNDFQAEDYPLQVTFLCEGDCQAVVLPPSNRDPNRLTTLIMTGVTALVRATAYKMEQKGVLYPGEVVRDTFRQADLLHISNEVPFAEGCPPPNPAATRRIVFCSAPKYFALLEDIGVDLIELTGNHFADWSTQATLFTTALYRQHQIPYFGGGDHLEEAWRPLLMEHNGNRLAFLGCNPVGPDFALATPDRPGAAPCDEAYFSEQIARLRAEGYLVIMTFQYYEYYTPDPRPWQLRDFRRMAEAGAVIVSGSQAHMAQAMEFYEDAFIHYGLGNLFFDQMNYILPDGSITPLTRQAFYDRHVFYHNRHISTELLTGQLEDFSRPRWMTPEERIEFLQRIWAFTDWHTGLSFSPMVTPFTPTPTPER